MHHNPQVGGGRTPLGLSITEKGTQHHPQAELAPPFTISTETIRPDSSTANNVQSGKHQLIRIRLPSDGVFSYTDSCLKMGIKVTHTNPLASKRLVNGAFHVFDRVVLRQGARVVKDTQFQHEIMDLHLLKRIQPDVAATQFEEMGFGPSHLRDAWAVGEGRDYSIPLDMGPLGLCPLPFGTVVPSVGARGFQGNFDLELYLNRPELCMESDDPNGLGFEISNIRWDVQRLVGEEFEKKCCDSFRNGRWLSYKEVERVQTPVTGSKQSIPISHRASNVDWMIGELVNLMTLAQPDSPIHNRHLERGRHFLLDWQLKDAPLRGALSVFPSEKVETDKRADRAYLFLKQWTGSQKLNGKSQDACIITQRDFIGELDPTQQTGAFCMIADFRSARPTDESQVHIINPQSSRNQGSDTKFVLNFSQPPVQGLALSVFIQYTVVAFMDASGYLTHADIDYRI